jgi:hypothetical protein
LAKRPVFVVSPDKEDFVEAVHVDFEWHPGFSIKQKQKSIRSLHASYLSRFPGHKILEISSKSEQELGVSLSAFNLMLRTKSGKVASIESTFQSSKVFEHGGPYTDLLFCSSREAKKDPRLKTSGKLVRFRFFEREWPLEPKTLFYDWLYILALSQNEDLALQLLEYDAFTDIEFNPDKSFNCQARSAALYVSLHRAGLLEHVLESEENYMVVMTRREANA